MKKEKHTYVVWVQYLGFRYSGWQKQPGQKTVEGMIRKTLKFSHPEIHLKILGASRTDAKVSASRTAFQMISQDGPIEAILEFVDQLNKNLPSDIRITAMEEVEKKFNIIQDVEIKEYRYLFSFGSKNHPFCAPFMANFLEDLDLSLMKRTARIFEGEHNFHNFTARLQPKTKSLRKVEYCKIEENKDIHASFFPDRSYVLIVKGEGFMRYQIRMIMGALVLLGKGELDESALEKALQPEVKFSIPFIAPGSGLCLTDLKLK